VADDEAGAEGRAADAGADAASGVVELRRYAAYGVLSVILLLSSSLRAEPGGFWLWIFSVGEAHSEKPYPTLPDCRRAKPPLRSELGRAVFARIA